MENARFRAHVAQLEAQLERYEAHHQLLQHRLVRVCLQTLANPSLFGQAAVNESVEKQQAELALWRERELCCMPTHTHESAPAGRAGGGENDRRDACGQGQGRARSIIVLEPRNTSPMVGY